MSEPSACDECGQPHVDGRGHASCVGHVRYDRDSYVPGQDRQPLDQPRPCKKARPRGIVGNWTCQKHGGAARQVKAKQERDRQRSEMEALMLTLGEPVDDSDPADVITERINARRGHVRWLLARVQALEPEALTWGLTKRKTPVDRDADGADSGKRFAGIDEGDTHEAKPHVWYALYEESAAKLERLCIEAIRVGLEERRVRIDEAMADMWVRVIDGMLVELGHDPNDPATAEIVARHLELVA